MSSPCLSARALVVLIALTLTMGMAAPPVASANGHCTFKLGFAALRDLIPDTVGFCQENERHEPATGNTLQRTTGGLLVWRKADNWTVFTDGATTWLNGPFGLQTRPNAGPMYPWEAQIPAAAPPQPPAPAAAPPAPSRPPAPQAPRRLPAHAYLPGAHELPGGIREHNNTYQEQTYASLASRKFSGSDFTAGFVVLSHDDPNAVQSWMLDSARSMEKKGGTCNPADRSKLDNPESAVICSIISGAQSIVGIGSRVKNRGAFILVQGRTSGTLVDVAVVLMRFQVAKLWNVGP